MTNSKTKILIVNPSGSLGGGNTVSNNLAIGLDKNIFEVFTFFPEKSSAISTLKETREINILIPPKSNLYSILFFLYSFLKENKIDIVHAQGTRAAFWTRLALIFLKRKPKVIYTLHGFHIIRRKFFLKWLLIFLERFLNLYTNILVCVSEGDKKLVLKYRTIPKNRIVLIKNGIDVEKFQVESELIETTKKELELENNFILTTIGRLHPPKDFPTILRALKLIIPQMQNVRLLIVGNGPLREVLEKETQDLSLNEYVKFLGWREDVPSLINLSDIIILSTRWEGLPLAPLEAGASKKPIIASDVEGVREAVIDGKTGYLFSPGSEKDLAEKILELTKSKELSERMGENGLEFVSKNFSKERMIKEYQKLYQLIL